MTLSPSDDAAIESLAFEAALAQLQDIVSTLENGSLSLEDAIERHQRGAALAAHCQKLLTEAEIRITTVSPEQGEQRDIDEVGGAHSR